LVYFYEIPHHAASTLRRPSASQRLLALAAIARWLTRNRAHDFAGLVLARIEQLSMNASGGTRNDATGLVSDLLNEEWYLQPHRRDEGPAQESA
jgi:hypothetical protein